MDSECEMIAGAKDSKNPLRGANWWGSDVSPVYYDKQKVLIDRPRLRGKGNQEISLETFQAFRNPKGMRNSVMKNMVLGISSRNYEETVEGFVKGYGIKKSSVSRHFVKATADQMREFRERDLSGLDLGAIFIDGIEFKGHLLVVALGLDKGGRKHGLQKGGFCDARKSLELTMKYLEKLNPSAAASLKEGLEETLTVHKFGITGLLKKTLQTTNPAFMQSLLGDKDDHR
jgi:putative transposase